MFSNPLDPNNCFIDIRRLAAPRRVLGAMLERMYLKSATAAFHRRVLEPTPASSPAQ